MWQTTSPPPANALPKFAGRGRRSQAKVITWFSLAKYLIETKSLSRREEKTKQNKRNNKGNQTNSALYSISSILPKRKQSQQRVQQHTLFGVLSRSFPHLTFASWAELSFPRRQHSYISRQQTALLFRLTFSLTSIEEYTTLTGAIVKDRKGSLPAIVHSTFAAQIGLLPSPLVQLHPPPHLLPQPPTTGATPPWTEACSNSSQLLLFKPNWPRHNACPRTWRLYIFRRYIRNQSPADDSAG